MQSIIRISLTAALAGILFGYDTGVISGAILYIDNQFHLSPIMNGWVVSSVLFGALIGALVSGKCNDVLGRKKLLLITSILFIIGTIITAVTPSIEILILGRIILGLAIGIASFSAPLYISELAPAEYRGALVSLNQLAITCGLLLSYMVDYYFTLLGSEMAWRYMFAFGILPALALFLGVFFLPESPRWLLSKGLSDEAHDVLLEIRGCNISVKQELEEITQCIKIDYENNSVASSSLRHILSDKKISQILIIAVSLAVIQQLTGINTILYYAPTILEMVGYSGQLESIYTSIGIGIVIVMSTLIALPMIDKLGRRFLLLTGLSGMSIGLLCLINILSTGVHTSLDKTIVLGSMLLYVASFSISLGPVVWLIIAEIFPLKIRGVGASIATCSNWTANLLIAYTFLTIISLFGITTTFEIYLFFCIVSMIFVYYFVPETKSISLEQIEYNLAMGKRWYAIGEV